MLKGDAFWMKKALAEARKGWGTVSPNPLVGAIVVRNGLLLGAGHHVKPGSPHAEINALAACAGAQLRGATLYVTLEPCSTCGRTPPCTEAILKAGIARVVFGCVDPNPEHAGRGAQILRRHGVQVTYPLCEPECRRLNAPFFKWITTGKPFVLLKLAQTLDGKIATKNGSSQWITGEAARRRVHQLRLRADAVMAGATTCRLDSPRFTARDARGRVLKSPRRIIVTRHPEKFHRTGFESVALPDRAAWDKYLRKLGSENVTFLLLEGGGVLAASALAAHAVDQVEFHLAPKILGGQHSRPGVGGPDPAALSSAYQLGPPEIKKLGADLAYIADVKYPDGEGQPVREDSCLRD